MRTLAIIVVIIVLVVALPSIGWVVFWKSTKTTKSVTVQEKWVKPHGDSTKYLFSDTDNNVYCICDDVLLLIWDASDRWARLVTGKTYEITFYGIRNHFLSWYPNAVVITETQ